MIDRKMTPAMLQQAIFYRGELRNTHKYFRLQLRDKRSVSRHFPASNLSLFGLLVY